MQYCQRNKGLEVFAWCIITNHVHLIIRAKESYLLENIMRDFKRHTSKIVVEAIQNNMQESRKEWLLEKFVNKDGINFRGTDNHPIELWSNKVIDQKLDYLHNNPLEKGLVFRAEQYV